MECRFEIRANDKQWTVSVEERLKRLEDGFQELLDAIQSNLGSPIVESVRPRVNSMSSELKSLGQVVQISKPIDDQEPCAKRQRVIGPDIISKGVIGIDQAKECILFFNTKLARYLPILVFKYMAQFDISVRNRSPVLFASILTVASLYHPMFQERHSAFRKEFELIASELDTDNTEDLTETVDAILALCLAGAWLGGELGFRMSIQASDIAGTALTPIQQKLSADQPRKKEMISSVGLMTYIIEQRLRIIHARPVDPTQTINGKRRDVFFSQFLASQMTHRKGHHEMDVAELKITANVELCAITLMLQLDLYREIKLDIIEHWNHQLDKWLAEWMGKLTVNLLPSSWKPVFLTFHFAKLFLNSLVVSHIKPNSTTWQPTIDPKIDEQTRVRIAKVAENSALDILDMLIRDRDTERLISVGPVFYPTIFITAGALLLKLVSIARSINYTMDEGKVVGAVREAYNVLSAHIASPVLPCYSSVQSLGTALANQKPASLSSDEQPVVMPQTSDLYQPPPPPPPGPPPPTQPVIDQPVWSFTPFHRSGVDQMPLNFDPTAAMWSNANNNVAEFMVDAYSASLLDSLGDVP